MWRARNFRFKFCWFSREECAQARAGVAPAGCRGRATLALQAGSRARLVRLLVGTQWPCRMPTPANPGTFGPCANRCAPRRPRLFQVRRVRCDPNPGGFPFLIMHVQACVRETGPALARRADHPARSLFLEPRSGLFGKPALPVGRHGQGAPGGRHQPRPQRVDAGIKLGARPAVAALGKGDVGAHDLDAGA